MGKPRRSRGPRSNWEPKPPLDGSPLDKSIPEQDSAADQVAPAAPEAPEALADAAPIETQAADMPTSEMPVSETSVPEVPAPESPIPESPAPEILAATPETVSAGDPPSDDAPPAGGSDPAPASLSQISGSPASEPEDLSADAPPSAAEPVAALAEAAPDFPPPARIPDPVDPGAPVPRMAALRFVFTPERLDVVSIGATIAGYMRKEGEAAAAHMRALSGARSPADLIRLQVGEVQRAADASLTCWSVVARKAGRAFALR